MMVVATMEGRAADRTRTTVDLDVELIARAGAVLGTSTEAATVRAALEQVVARADVDALLRQDFSALDAATIADLRTPRPPP